MPPDPRAALVVDLGFGDAGKGLVTDFLVRSLGAGVVVRFNGGAQAGHNVVAPDGRHHTFAQIGAGTFVPGVRTHLAARTAVHPTALGVEAAHLAAIGVPDALERLSVDARALVITPMHQAGNRLRELGRGAARHGSCGVGAGEAVADAIARPDEAIRMGDLRDLPRVRRALRRLQERKREDLAAVVRALADHPAARAERAVLDDPAVIDRWIDAAAPTLARVAVVDEGWLGPFLAGPAPVVFEGAQGVLLDEWAGFHPHTTYSTCTFEGALEILRTHAFAGDVLRIGVLRTYATRHGDGPLPTEDASLAPLLPEAHNAEGPWQGPVRRGWPDALLARYAAACAGGLDAVALTHLDDLDRVPAWRACRAYRLARPDARLFEATTADPHLATAVRPPADRDLDRQAALAAALLGASPVLDPVEWRGEAGADRAIAFFEEALGAPVRLASWGPRATDVRPR